MVPKLNSSTLVGVGVMIVGAAAFIWGFKQVF